MAEHTKGNWERGEIFAFLDVFVDDKQICHCGSDEYISDDMPIEERKANARLISAAPDLLEACEMVIQQLTSDKFNVVIYPDVEPYSFKLVKAAIAKAKGELK